MKNQVVNDRRDFIKNLALLTPMALLGVRSLPVRSQVPELFDEEENGVGGSAVEDLMMEHGVLDRLLLIYENSRQALLNQGYFRPQELFKAAQIMRDFIQGHHEKDEEEDIFPLLERHQQLVQEVRILWEQHDVGRKITAFVLRMTKFPLHPGNPGALQLAQALGQFITMYRPHAAREDTLIYPVFKKLVTPQQYREIGEKFEESEHRLFGQAGIMGILQQIEEVEKNLGLNDLQQFTPHLPFL